MWFTPEAMEIAVLQFFPAVESVEVKKHGMYRSTAYCSFSVFANPMPGSDLELDDFLEFSWPDDIKCYPHKASQTRRV